MSMAAHGARAAPPTPEPPSAPQAPGQGRRGAAAAHHAVGPQTGPQQPPPTRGAAPPTGSASARPLAPPGRARAGTAAPKAGVAVAGGAGRRPPARGRPEHRRAEPAAPPPPRARPRGSDLRGWLGPDTLYPPHPRPGVHLASPRAAATSSPSLHEELEELLGASVTPSPGTRPPASRAAGPLPEPLLRLSDPRREPSLPPPGSLALPRDANRSLDRLVTELGRSPRLWRRSLLLLAWLLASGHAPDARLATTLLRVAADRGAPATALAIFDWMRSGGGESDTRERPARATPAGSAPRLPGAGLRPSAFTYTAAIRAASAAGRAGAAVGIWRDAEADPAVVQDARLRTAGIEAAARARDAGSALRALRSMLGRPRGDPLAPAPHAFTAALRAAAAGGRPAAARGVWRELLSQGAGVVPGSVADARARPATPAPSQPGLPGPHAVAAALGAAEAARDLEGARSVWAAAASAHLARRGEPPAIDGVACAAAAAALAACGDRNGVASVLAVEASLVPALPARSRARALAPAARALAASGSWDGALAALAEVASCSADARDLGAAAAGVLRAAAAERAGAGRLGAAPGKASHALELAALLGMFDRSGAPAAPRDAQHSALLATLWRAAGPSAEAHSVARAPSPGGTATGGPGSPRLPESLLSSPEVPRSPAGELTSPPAAAPPPTSAGDRRRRRGGIAAAAAAAWGLARLARRGPRWGPRAGRDGGALAAVPAETDAASASDEAASSSEGEAEAKVGSVMHVIAPESATAGPTGEAERDAAGSALRGAQPDRGEPPAALPYPPPFPFHLPAPWTALALCAGSPTVVAAAVESLGRAGEPLAALYAAEAARARGVPGSAACAAASLRAAGQLLRPLAGGSERGAEPPSATPLLSLFESLPAPDVPERAALVLALAEVGQARGAARALDAWLLALPGAPPPDAVLGPTLRALVAEPPREAGRTVLAAAPDPRATSSLDLAVRLLGNSLEAGAAVSTETFDVVAAALEAAGRALEARRLLASPAYLEAEGFWGFETPDEPAPWGWLGGQAEAPSDRTPWGWSEGGPARPVLPPAATGTPWARDLPGFDAEPRGDRAQALRARAWDGGLAWAGGAAGRASWETATPQDDPLAAYGAAPVPRTAARRAAARLPHFDLLDGLALGGHSVLGTDVLLTPFDPRGPPQAVGFGPPGALADLAASGAAPPPPTFLSTFDFASAAHFPPNPNHASHAGLSPPPAPLAVAAGPTAAALRLELVAPGARLATPATSDDLSASLPPGRPADW